MQKRALPRLAAIVAMAENRIIGVNNQLPWHLPADLKHFKTLTTGHTIIMGRKTYLSIGKPLPNRTNIVISRDPDFNAEGCLVAHSLEDAIVLGKKNEQEMLFIIGGATLYEQAMLYVDRLYITLVHQYIEGDTSFPLLDTHNWQEIERERFEADEKNQYAYSFLTLERI